MLMGENVTGRKYDATPKKNREKATAEYNFDFTKNMAIIRKQLL